MKKKTKAIRRFNARNMWKANFRKVSFNTVIKPLFRKLIEPCLKHMILTEDQTRMHHGVRIWFGVSERPIGCYKVKKSFQMPGVTRDPDSLQLENVTEKEKTIRRGDQLWVRFHENRPDFVEVELDHSAKVFELKLPDWNGIRTNLEYVG